MRKKGIKTKKTTGAKRIKKKEDNKICFCIMPFGHWFDRYYNEIFKPAIVCAGLEPHRADDLYTPSDIINDIWSYTTKAEVLLADLTGKNPNVFYELGLAHAISKSVIMVTENIDEIPFDLRSLRIIKYDRKLPEWGKKLKEDITCAIEETIESKKGTVLPTFMRIKEEDKGKKISLRDKDILELKQEVNMLKKEVRSYKPVSTGSQPSFYPVDSAIDVSNQGFLPVDYRIDISDQGLTAPTFKVIENDGLDKCPNCGNFFLSVVAGTKTCAVCNTSFAKPND